MALGGKTVDVHLWWTTELFQAARARARKLGYRSVSEWLRCVVSRELREPRIPDALTLFGRPSRKLGIARPKH